MSHEPTGLALYDKTAQDAAAAVIAAYSTSFGLATRLLGPRPRPHVRNIYALVRIADEIVDGPAAAAGLDADAERAVLDELETETLAAIDRGFSSNLVVHAFARTARECGIGAGPHRARSSRSMRTDLLDRAARRRLARRLRLRLGRGGRADVPAGLRERRGAASGHPDADLVDGARRLGAAFQDVNFLRDLHHDEDALGRDYLGLGVGRVHARREVLDRIDADLAAAAAVIPRLPPTAAAPSPRRTTSSPRSPTRLRRDAAPDERVRVPDAGEGAPRRARVARLRAPRSGARPRMTAPNDGGSHTWRTTRRAPPS